MNCKKCGAELPSEARFCPMCGKAVNYTPAPRKRPNGSGTVYKRGKTWMSDVTLYITTDADGKLHRKRARKSGFATKKEALAYIAELKKSEQRTMPTLLDLYTVWEENDMPKLSKDKQSGYKKARERLEPLIHRRIDSLTTTDLQNVVNAQASSYYTAKDMKVLLSHLYKRAVADQFVPTNLSQFITLPELVEKEAETFNEEEVRKMWTAFADGDMFVGYILVMLYSGMRPIELFSVRKSKIDFDRCEIHGAGRKTKVSKDTPIVFSATVKPVLRALCGLYDDDRLYPKHETAFYDEYHICTARIGIRDLPPYAARHTFATNAANLKLSPSVIQKIMRHAKITTSQRYIHLADDVAHEAVDSMK